MPGLIGRRGGKGGEVRMGTKFGRLEKKRGGVVLYSFLFLPWERGFINIKAFYWREVGVIAGLIGKGLFWAQGQLVAD